MLHSLDLERCAPYQETSSYVNKRKQLKFLIPKSFTTTTQLCSVVKSADLLFQSYKICHDAINIASICTGIAQSPAFVSFLSIAIQPFIHLSIYLVWLGAQCSCIVYGLNVYTARGMKDGCCR